MKYFIFRNQTIEHFFNGMDASFSGYSDISYIEEEAESYIWFYVAPYKPVIDEVADEISSYQDMLKLLLKRLNNNKQFIAFTMYDCYKIQYTLSNRRLENIIDEYNNTLYALADKRSNVKIVNMYAFSKHFGINELIDWKYWFISSMPFNPKISKAFSEWFAHQIAVINGVRKKCLITDLDNTLWGGILGEDGINAIKMSGDYPGKSFQFFQEFLLELKKSGIILAICSKNNEQDVLEVFRTHPDIKLRIDDFIAYRINWNNKTTNIQSIAKELNIGLDSIVFIDDNKAERELIKQTLPAVNVPEFPAQYYLYPEFCIELVDNYFSAYTLTHEDMMKTQKYQENIEREHYKEQFVDMDSYIKSLHIVLKIEKLNEYNITRFAQMTQKTNQFNLTTHRYTDSDIQRFADEGSLVYGLTVKDKFGDNGITGLIIVDINENTAFIQTFLLSCRILGKGIEDAFLKLMLLKLKQYGIKLVEAEYLRTLKNEQVSNFYDKNGFTPVKIGNDTKKYQYMLEVLNEELSDLYTYNMEDL
jgi:FkbH-like protein